MKRVVILSIVLAFVASACGLKVPVSITSNSGTQTGDFTTQPGADVPGGDTAGPDAVVPTGQAKDTKTDTPVDGVPTGPISGLFESETEGVTKDQITLFVHVPITGAAPIARHANRFGQFYFDYVNKELGGIHGRKVRFLAFDDQYYPAGARAAAEKCAREGSFIYLG